jgi:toxin YoeB
VSWDVQISKQAAKDAKKLLSAGLWNKAEQLIAILAANPYQNPPPYGKLMGDLSGFYSRRINIQHRMVYQVLEDKREVRILRMWSHYE